MVLKNNKLKNDKKAQVSVEFLMIIGFVFLILIPLIIAFYQQSYNANTSIRTEQLYKLARSIVDRAESVYFLGKPSKTTIRAYIPHGVDSVIISGKEIVFRIKVGSEISEIAAASKVNLSGSISPHQGIHNIQIEARDGFVQITG